MKIWTWMHPHPEMSDNQLRDRLASFAKAGIRGILFLAYDGRQAFFPTSNVPVASLELQRVASLAAELGLECHGWMFTLNCNVERVLEEHPDWFVVNRNGKSTLEERPYVEYYNWLCPNREGVRRFVLGLVEDLARQSLIQGVHLDYIRFPDVILPKALQSHYGLKQDRELPQFDYCYCEVCRETYRGTQGIDPLNLSDPSESPEWREFREQSITNIVREAAHLVHRLGKQISAAVFATPTLARQLVRQNWPQWPLDAVFPMIYHIFYGEPPEWIEAASREAASVLRGRVELYAGLFVPELKGQLLGRSLQLAKAGGAQGISLFAAEHIGQEEQEQLSAARESFGRRVRFR